MKERIENELPIDFDVLTIEFKDNNDGTQISDETIELLCSFNNSEQLPEAIELLLEYYSKRPDLFNEVYTAFIREFGIDKDSEISEYHSFSLAVEYLCKYIKTNNSINALTLFVRVAIHYLKLNISKVEGGRRNTFTYYTISIKATPKVIKYRKSLLCELRNIYEKDLFKNEIEHALNKYGTGNSDHVDYEVVKEEYNDIMSIVVQFQTDSLYHCTVVEHLKRIFEKAEIEFDNEIIDKFIYSPKNVIYNTIKGDKIEYLSMTQDEEHQHRISVSEDLIKDYSIDDYDFLFQIAQDIDNNFENNVYDFSTGLEYIFDVLSKNDALFIEVVRLYLSYNTPCNVRPANIIEKLFRFMTADAVKALIDDYEFTQKNTWSWHYYVEMPENQIEVKHIDEILSFLANPSTQLKSAGYRPLDDIKKYSIVDENIFEKASRALLDNYDKSPFIFNLYFHHLFIPHHISPRDLISLYSFDESLLANIYIKCISYAGHFDYDGTFLMVLLKVIPGLIDNYLNHITQPVEYKHRNYESDMHRLRGIWKESDYIDKINYIVDNIYSILKDRRWDFEECVKSLFVSDHSEKEEMIAKQDEWIRQCIERNYTNSDFVCNFFEILTDFPTDRRRAALLKFLELNSNYDDFEKIPLEPFSLSGSGSLIPCMKNRISYLSSLIPYLSGIKYLKHRQRLESCIEVWKERIKREEEHELLEDWF